MNTTPKERGEKKKKMRIHRMYGNSVIGKCCTCGMEFENYLKPREAYNHAKKTGHKVIVEITNNFHYN